MDYAELLFEKAITRYAPEAGVPKDKWEWQAGEYIRRLEAALKPFAQLLLSETTDEIDPAGMYVLRVDIEDADVTGREVIAARKALSM